MARSIDKDGNLIDPVKAPWKTGGAFTTPPGWWHSHVNETDEDAWVLPVQDAGLFTYQVGLRLQNGITLCAVPAPCSDVNASHAGLAALSIVLLCTHHQCISALRTHASHTLDWDNPVVLTS